MPEIIRSSATSGLLHWDRTSSAVQALGAKSLSDAQLALHQQPSAPILAQSSAAQTVWGLIPKLGCQGASKVTQCIFLPQAASATQTPLDRRFSDLFSKGKHSLCPRKSPPCSTSLAIPKFLPGSEISPLVSMSHEIAKQCRAAPSSTFHCRGLLGLFVFFKFKFLTHGWVIFDRSLFLFCPSDRSFVMNFFPVVDESFTLQWSNRKKSLNYCASMSWDEFKFYPDLVVNWALFTFNGPTLFCCVRGIDSKEINLEIIPICILFLKTGFL